MSSLLARRPPTRRLQNWDQAIPPVLRPLIRAYLLGYVSSVGPRLLTLILHRLARRSAKKPSLQTLRCILCRGLDWQRFPAFCAALVGGSTLLQIPLRRLLENWATSLPSVSRDRISRWVSTFIAAWLSLRLLQSRQTPEFTETLVPESITKNAEPRTVRYAGRTLDLTLFAAVRALDVIVGALWSRRKARRTAANHWNKLDSAVSKFTDPAIFATSCALIMWTWIYLPSRLSPAYNKWITAAAAVDPRLIEGLRRVRNGDIQYGKANGQEALLQSMCAEYKWPLEWGDPTKAIPFPCEMVHMGCGPSCEFHALSRFCRSFPWAMATYLPLALALQLRKPSIKGAKEAVLSASRSSAFLGAFIALFYYGVCLARNRIGPHVLGKDTAARNQIDSGICVGSGCALCGWSILIEKAGRQKDMALFVAPRALATLFPRRYSMDNQWKETLVFSLSTAVVFTRVLEDGRVRGVLGKVLRSVLKP